MHTPSHFEETRTTAMHALIRAHPLAVLVTQSNAGIDAEHIPLLLVESGSFGVLQGHVARSNPMGASVGDDSDILAIFQGPNFYISPNWYPSKHADGKVVPTWNYLVVHARGKIRWKHDLVWLRRHLEAATETHENTDNPWRISDAPEEFVERMLTAIVGFEIHVSQLRGKWRLSQNRSKQDKRGVIDGLKRLSSEGAAEMSAWMESDEGAA